MDQKMIPDFYYEQYALGELDVENCALLEADEYTLNKKLNEINASNQALLFAYPPKRMVEEIHEKKAKQVFSIPLSQRIYASLKRMKKVFYLPLLAPVAASVLAFFVFYSPSEPSLQQLTNADGDVIMLRGLDSGLKIYRKTADRTELLEDNQKVHENDLIQMSYIAAGKSYGTIFSIDGNGIVTLHYPERVYVIPSLEPSGEIKLNQAYILDDAPEYEKFFFVTSNSSFDVRQILRAAENIRDPQNEQLILPSGFEQSSITLEKENIK